MVSEKKNSNVTRVKVYPPSPNNVHVFQRIKISLTLFEKGHPSTTSVKLFQNLTDDLSEEEF